MSTYKIYEGFIDTLVSKLSTISKKCSKYECPFTFKILGEEYISIRIESQERPYPLFRRFITVEVEGELKIDGWKFVATIEHTPKGNVIRTANVEVEIPEIYFTRTICDHCNTNRNRRETYLIQNEETGEFKQVGKQCLKEYLGIDAEDYAKYLAYTDTIQKTMETEIKDNSSSTTRYFSAKDVLYYADQIIKQCGYCSVEKAKEDGEISNATRYKVYDRLMEVTSTTPETEEVNKIIKWIQQLDAKNNNYYTNLQTIIECGYVSIKSIGILVSAIPAYNKYTHEQESIDKYEFPEGISIGDKITLKGVKMEFISTVYSYYGTVYLYHIYEGNHLYVWWASSNQYWEGPVAYVNISGRVKSTEIYKGCKQVVLKNCKVEVIDNVD